MLSAMALAALAWAASAPAVKADSAKADSLRGLEVLISSEFKGGNQVLRLENKIQADSLIQVARTRDAFLSRIRDSSVARRFGTETEFKEYWKRIETEAGFQGLRGQLEARDIDKSRIPKRYLFDSSVVIYPGWIVLRHMHR